MLFSWEGKVGVVTGGAQGIGPVICEAFAQQRATELLIDIGAAAVRKTQKKVGAACHKYACDVTDRGAVQRAFAAAARAHGSFDIPVKSAGIAHTGTAEPTIEAGFERVFEVNVKGVFFP